MTTLNQVSLGQLGVVRNLRQGEVSVRLMELGLLPEVQVRPLFRAPFGDPVAVEVDAAYVVSLRLEEAALIEVDIQA
ncbi:MAG: FeoA family protein [Bacteroidia bacterium]|nr:FeoA family protein [Bacteroidia bacterium]